MLSKLQHPTADFTRIAINVLILGVAPFLAATLARSEEDETSQKAPTYSVLYTFTGGVDGAFPGGTDLGLILDKKGNLYGTTSAGGDVSGCSGFRARLRRGVSARSGRK